MAVCCDVYVSEEKNHFFGKPRDNNKPHILDTRETVTKVTLAFLTSHLVDINGEMKPGYVTARESFGWGGEEKQSNLYKLVKGWFPTATRERIIDMDLSKLIGQSGYITVTHKGNYANVVSVSQPPPGVQPVQIPADFKTREQKAAAAPQLPVGQPVAPPVAPAPPQHQPLTNVAPGLRPPLPVNPNAPAWPPPVAGFGNETGEVPF